jgi:hypothetical protein
MKGYSIAGLIMIIHGGIIEISGRLILFLTISKNRALLENEPYLSLFIPEREHLNRMLMLGGIYGIIRLIAALGLFMNRMWGFMLSGIISAITLLLMPFMPPAGILDGFLAAVALILILVQFYEQLEIFRGPLS